MEPRENLNLKEGVVWSYMDVLRGSCTVSVT